MIDREWIGIVAGILAIGGYLPYILAILRGETKPNRATWLIWTIVGALLASSYFETGDRNAIWLPMGYFFGPLSVAILSIRYGYAEWTRMDTICIILAAISVIPWVLSNDAIFTLLINVFIDATGAVPTLIKTWKEPETEDFVAWFIFFVANTLEVLTLTTFDLSALYPIYLFFLAGGITLMILKGKILKRARH